MPTAEGHAPPTAQVQRHESAAPALPQPQEAYSFTLEEKLYIFYDQLAPHMTDRVHEMIAHYEGDEAQIDAVLRGSYGLGLADTQGTTRIEFGESVPIDELGPVIINHDGTTRRIANWRMLTPREQVCASEWLHGVHAFSFERP